MTAASRDKVAFFTLAFISNVTVIALLWSLSPISTFKPHPATYANFNQYANASLLPRTKMIMFGKPTRIIVDSPAIDLPVKVGAFDKSSGQWTLGNYAAYYASPSVPPNTSNGNTLIYAHNNRTAFYTLKSIAPGAKLIVETDTGYEFTYRYSSASDVTPDDLGVFSQLGPPRVTLQTCSGNWNEYRRLFQFNYYSIHKVTK